MLLCVPALGAEYGESVLTRAKSGRGRGKLNTREKGPRKMLMQRQLDGGGKPREKKNTVGGSGSGEGRACVPEIGRLGAK